MLGSPENEAEPLSHASFEHSGGICSKRAVDIFGVATQFATFWRQEPKADDWDPEALQFAEMDLAYGVFTCLESKETAASGTSTTLSQRSSEAGTIAGCLVDPNYIVSDRPAAAIVLEKKCPYSFESGGGVYHTETWWLAHMAWELVKKMCEESHCQVLEGSFQRIWGMRYFKAPSTLIMVF